MIKNKRDYAKNNQRTAAERRARQSPRRPTQVPKEAWFSLAAALCLLIYSLRPSSNGTWNKISFLTSFFSSSREAIHSKWASVKGFFASKDDLLAQISHLESHLLDLERQVVAADSLRAENEYLRQLVPLVNDQMAATLSIIQTSLPTDPFVVLSSIPVDQCLRVRIGDIAFSPQGFFGTVVAKDKDNITVLLATHIRSRIAVISRQSRKRALLFGNNSSTFSVRYVDDLTDGSLPFTKKPQFLDDLVEGEILDLYSLQHDFKIPVAKVVKKNGKVFAEWLITTRTRYMTLLVQRP